MFRERTLTLLLLLMLRRTPNRSLVVELLWSLGYELVMTPPYRLKWSYLVRIVLLGVLQPALAGSMSSVGS